MVNSDMLKKARMQKGFSIRQMSRFINAKSSATYYNIENNKSEPKTAQLKTISDKLEIP